jgi:hypothetical protein
MADLKNIVIQDYNDKPWLLSSLQDLFQDLVRYMPFDPRSPRWLQGRERDRSNAFVHAP